MTPGGTRIDHDIILDLVPRGARVLDLGCGDGSLLEKLVRTKGVRGSGIEISDDGVRSCIEKGLAVLQGDIDEGLRDYPDRSFDYIILNQTLQAVKKPDVVLGEMLRVGEKAVVGFPNFAYWKMLVYRVLAIIINSSNRPYSGILWTQTFDGIGDDYGNCIKEAEDGGLIICGSAGSFGAGNEDVDCQTQLSLSSPRFPGPGCDTGWLLPGVLS